MVRLDGLGWGVFTILHVEKEIPGPNRWRNGPWMKLPFELKQAGVDLEGILTWAFHIAQADVMVDGRMWYNSLDQMETCERVEREMRDHNRDPELVQPEVEAGVAGVAKILGSYRPTRQQWNDYHWVKALFELQERGVKVEDFQAWGRYVAGRTRTVEVVNLSDDESPKTSFQEVDGPGPHKTVVRVESQRGKRKREEAEISSKARG